MENPQGYQHFISNQMLQQIQGYGNIAVSTSPFSNLGLRQEAYLESRLAGSLILQKSKTVAKMIKEDFKKISSKPIVKEIMSGLLKLKKEEVSQVVNEMLAI